MTVLAFKLMIDFIIGCIFIKIIIDMRNFSAI